MLMLRNDGGAAEDGKLAHLPIIYMHVATELVEHEVRWFL